MLLSPPADLGERLRAADEDVLADVLQEFGPAVSAVLRQRYEGVLDAADVEDVISIGLFRLWNSRARYDSAKSSLKVWFFRIVDNAARDVLKFNWHKARTMEVGTEPRALAGYSDPRRNGHAESNTGPLSRRSVLLKEILADLPERQRRIVMADALARDRVASSEFLAKELDMPASSVPVYRKRAMDKIRREMRKRGVEG